MKIICLISGGIDSTTMLFRLYKNNHEVIPLFVNYGQKSIEQERKAASTACEILKLKLNTIDISGLSQISSGLTDNTKSTVNPFFPNRNIILLSIASSFSVEHSCSVIAIGIIGGTDFADQTKEFIESAEETLSYGRKIIILTPLIELNKLEVVRLAKVNDIPLDFTYSCYEGFSEPCGKCTGCIDKKHLLDIEDMNQS